MNLKSVPFEALDQLERFHWLEYVRPRFPLGGDVERSERDGFKRLIAGEYRRISVEGQKYHEAPNFCEVRLRLFVLEKLEGACPYCTRLMGLANFGLVYDTSPGRAFSHCFQLANLVCCCGCCAKAKGSLSGGEWLDIQAALKAADPNAAHEMKVALCAGRAVVVRRRAGRGSSPGGAARE
jgi:hypothetical protein